jgi:hypothetical protein
MHAHTVFKITERAVDNYFMLEVPTEIKKFGHLWKQLYKRIPRESKLQNK